MLVPLAIERLDPPVGPTLSPFPAGGTATDGQPAVFGAFFRLVGWLVGWLVISAALVKKKSSHF